MSQVEEKLLTE